MGRILLTFLLLSLTGCFTFNTQKLLNKYETTDELAETIGEPSYVLDNRYVWAYKKTTIENVRVADAPEMIQETKFSHGQYKTTYKTNYDNYHFEKQAVTRSCELVLVVDNNKRLIFKEATGNGCDAKYFRQLEKYLKSKKRITVSEIVAADTEATIMWILHI